ncbi:MAG: RDD family protein [Caldanaerobacter subterraneus]|nr:RDD family protein [Caldanaerobacter subterraneus]
MEYAGFWRRAAAFLLDNVVLFLLGIVLGATAYLFFDGVDENILDIFLSILGIVISWLYFTILESSELQATIGKRIMKTKVVDMNGNRISFGKANIRYWSKLISAVVLLIGYIMIAFTPKKQGLHDMIAGTLVIKDTQI